MLAPRVNLNDGNSMPQIGLGVAQMSDREATESCLRAFEHGYRHVDTATLYGNELGVGRAIELGGLPREDLFITTKVRNRDQGYESTVRACHESLSKLGLDAVDLYLVHFPSPGRGQYVETWQALIDLQESGLAHSIGVSNFHSVHLQAIDQHSNIVPTVNQIELHPWLPQESLRSENQSRGIVTVAWSPLGSGALLQEPVLQAIAERHGVSTAQVLIRWHLDLGNVVIPKSVTPERIRSNLEVFDLQLDDDDRAAIATLRSGVRTGPNPDEFNDD